MMSFSKYNGGVSEGVNHLFYIDIQNQMFMNYRQNVACLYLAKIHF